MLAERGKVEQRYQAVLAVQVDGLTVTEVAEKFGVSRQTVHAQLRRYEGGGLDGLGDRSHRPVSCPHQVPAVVEARVCELRRQFPYWGPVRIARSMACSQASSARRRQLRPNPTRAGPPTNPCAQLDWQSPIAPAGMGCRTYRLSRY